MDNLITTVKKIAKYQAFISIATRRYINLKIKAIKTI
jgi:hypothetical protein